MLISIRMTSGWSVFGQFDGLLAVVSLAHNFKIGLVTQQASQALTHHGMVIGEQYPNLSFWPGEPGFNSPIEPYWLCAGHRLKRFINCERDCQSKTRPFPWRTVDLKPTADKVDSLPDAEQPKTTTFISKNRYVRGVKSLPAIADGYPQRSPIFLAQLHPCRKCFGVFHDI